MTQHKATGWGCSALLLFLAGVWLLLWNLVKPFSLPMRAGIGAGLVASVVCFAAAYRAGKAKP